jgi:hypothetical protein
VLVLRLQLMHRRAQRVGTLHGALLVQGLQ